MTQDLGPKSMALFIRCLVSGWCLVNHAYQTPVFSIYKGHLGREVSRCLIETQCKKLFFYFLFSLYIHQTPG